MVKFTFFLTFEVEKFTFCLTCQLFHSIFNNNITKLLEFSSLVPSALPLEAQAQFDGRQQNASTRESVRCLRTSVLFLLSSGLTDLDGCMFILEYAHCLFLNTQRSLC